MNAEEAEGDDGVADRRALRDNLVARAAEWSTIFTSLDKEAQRNQHVVAGAVEIKKALALLQKDDPASQSWLLACQRALQGLILGLLDVTFPNEERVVDECVLDEESLEDAFAPLDHAISHAEQLATLFHQHALEPAAQPQEQAPELLEMLAASASGPEVAREERTPEQTARIERWKNERGGRLSTVLGSELFEVVCWRRGNFRYQAAAEAVKQVEGQSGPPPAEGLLHAAVEAFELMRRAQGPLRSDGDGDYSKIWTKEEVREKNETAALLHHGIYTSNHLLGMKKCAEVTYWLWRYHGERWQQQAERILWEFVHIVENIMPDRGWTAAWERRSLKEVHAASVAAVGALEAEHAAILCFEEEFGALDVQQEIDKLKMEDGNHAAGNGDKGGKARAKQKKRK